MRRPHVFGQADGGNGWRRKPRSERKRKTLINSETFRVPFRMRGDLRYFDLCAPVLIGTLLTPFSARNSPLGQSSLGSINSDHFSSRSQFELKMAMARRMAMTMVVDKKSAETHATYLSRLDSLAKASILLWLTR